MILLKNISVLMFVIMPNMKIIYKLSHTAAIDMLQGWHNTERIYSLGLELKA